MDEKIVEELIEIIPILDFDYFNKHFGDLIEEEIIKVLDSEFPNLKWNKDDLLKAIDRLIKDGVIETYKCYHFVN